MTTSAVDYVVADFQSTIQSTSCACSPNRFDHHSRDNHGLFECKNINNGSQTRCMVAHDESMIHKRSKIVQQATTNDDTPVPLTMYVRVCIRVCMHVWIWQRMHLM
jgi:hypothetical protein